MDNTEPIVQEIADAVAAVLRAEGYVRKIEEAIAPIADCESPGEAINEAYIVMAEHGIEPLDAQNRLVAMGISV